MDVGGHYLFISLYKEIISLIIWSTINIIVTPSSVVEVIVSPPLYLIGVFLDNYRLK